LGRNCSEQTFRKTIATVWQLFVEYLEILFHSLRNIVNSIKTVVKLLISIFVGNSYEKLKRFVKYCNVKDLIC
jgi:hypothetical protein